MPTHQEAGYGPIQAQAHGPPHWGQGPYQFPSAHAFVHNTTAPLPPLPSQGQLVSEPEVIPVEQVERRRRWGSESTAEKTEDGSHLTKSSARAQETAENNDAEGKDETLAVQLASEGLDANQSDSKEGAGENPADTSRAAPREEDFPPHS